MPKTKKKKKDDNLKKEEQETKEQKVVEEKTVEDMSSEELEEYINKIPPLEEETHEVVKKEEEDKKEPQPEEEKQLEEGVTPPTEEEPKPWYEKYSQEVQDLAQKKGWKSETDWVNSYQEAEKKISQQGEEASLSKRELEVLKKQIDGLSQVQGTQTTGGDPLAQIRPYFPDMTDEQIQNQMGLMGLMINAALKNYRKEQEETLKPVRELVFDRSVERQKTTVKSKYADKIPGFDSYWGKAIDILDRLPADIRAKEGSVETIFLRTVGEGTPEIIQTTRQEIEQKVKDDLTKVTQKKEDAEVETPGATSVPAPKKPVSKMSSEEVLDLIQSHPDYKDQE